MSTVLRHRAFRWVAAIYASDSLLEWFSSIALMVLVYRETESTTVSAGLLIFKQVLPGALLPLIGRRLEGLEPGRGLAAMLVVQAAALGAIGALGYGPLLFPLALVAGTTGAAARASLRTAAARTLQGDDLRAGNALMNITMGVAALAGPALAALIVGVQGPGIALLLTAGLMTIGALAALVPDLPAVSAAPDDDETPVAASGRARSGAPLSWLLLLVGVVSCIFSMDDPTLLAYSEQSLHAGVAGYGAIFTAWGIGATAGSLLFTRLMHWPMLRVYALATVLAGGAYLGMAVSPTITVTCLFAVVGGIGNGMDWVALVTAIQEAAPKGGEARAAMLLESITTAGPGIGILAGGILADHASPRLTLLIPGVLAFAVLATGATLLRLRDTSAFGRRPQTNFSPSIHGGSA